MHSILHLAGIVFPDHFDPRQQSEPYALSWTDYKCIAAGIFCVSAIAYFFSRMMNQTGQPPITRIEIDQTRIRTTPLPAAERPPANTPVHLTFCIDTSRSMHYQHRLQNIQNALLQFIQQMQNSIATDPKLPLDISILTFDENKPDIVSSVRPGDKIAVSTIENAITSLAANSDMTIVQGLEKAQLFLQKQSGTRFLVFLSDGYEEKSTQAVQYLRKIKSELEHMQAALYVVEIGRDGYKDFLASISAQPKIKNNSTVIQKTISEIFFQIIRTESLDAKPVR